MGTSSAYGGPRGGTPLVPTWLEPEATEGPEALVPSDGSEFTADPPIDSDIWTAPPESLPDATPAPGRFTAPRSNFSRFAASGGRDRASLGRALSRYVSSSSGGASRATQRMGSARAAGARLLSFLSDAQAHGVGEALQALDLASLAGRRIEDIFLGLTNYVCPDGGTVDEGIARDAFIETIADLSGEGITDLDALTADQMQTVFELYATHAIEARIINDIGMKAVTLPADLRAAASVQMQLRDFVRRGVSDALTNARTTLQALTPSRVLDFVDGVYQTAFGVLRELGQAEDTA